MYRPYCHKTYNYGEYRHAEKVKNIKEEDDPHKLGDRKPEICNQKRPNIRSIYQRVQHPIMVPQNPRFIIQFSDIVNDRNMLSAHYPSM